MIIVTDVCSAGLAKMAHLLLHHLWRCLHEEREVRDNGAFEEQIKVLLDGSWLIWTKPQQSGLINA